MNRWIAALPLCAAACLDAPPSGPGAPDTCGTVRSLSDQFDAVTDLWEQHSATVGGGAMILEAGPGESSWVITPWARLLDGGELTLALRGVELTGNAQLRLYFITVEDDSIGLQLQAGVLSVVIDVAGDTTSPASIDWPPDQMWWRARQTAGRFEWATSADGQEWLEQEPVESPLSEPVVVLIEASGDSGQAAVEIEAVNPDAGETACPASSLVDDFATELPRWSATDLPACDVFADERLLVRSDQVDPCGLISLERFDMRGSSVGLQVLEVGGGDCDPSFSMAVAFPDLAAEIRCLNDGDGPTLIGGLYGSDIDETFVSVDYRPSDHRFWRIANPPGTSDIEVATAGDDGVWRTLGSRPIDAAQLASGGINLLVVDESPDGVTEEVQVDNLNLVPP